MLKVSDFDHIPVLLYQTVDALNVKPGGIYVDCTAGGGSHSAEIARRMKGQGTLISIDKDDAALAACMERRESFAGIDWMPVKSDYKDIDDIIRSLKLGKVDGIMADLGVSSYQLDTAERGFSYMKNGPLDMRMDPDEWLTAAEVVNKYSRDDLERIFREYGEEHHAGRIADGICERRRTRPFTRTTELANAIKEYMPGHGRGESIGNRREGRSQTIDIAANVGTARTNLYKTVTHKGTSIKGIKNPSPAPLKANRGEEGRRSERPGRRKGRRHASRCPRRAL